MDILLHHFAQPMFKTGRGKTLSNGCSCLLMWTDNVGRSISIQITDKIPEKQSSPALFEQWCHQLPDEEGGCWKGETNLHEPFVSFLYFFGSMCLSILRLLCMLYSTPALNKNKQTYSTRSHGRLKNFSTRAEFDHYANHSAWRLAFQRFSIFRRCLYSLHFMMP